MSINNIASGNLIKRNKKELICRHMVFEITFLKTMTFCGSHLEFLVRETSDYTS